MVIFDTNILIEIYNGNETVNKQVDLLPEDVFYVSSVTVAEFLAGAKNKDELRLLEKYLGRYNVVGINDEISDIFVDLYKKYVLSHRPGIPDLLIAATALYYHLPLYTLNKKDFQYVPNLRLI